MKIRTYTTSWLAGFVLLSGLLLAGCPPEEPESGPCEGVTCDFGTCDSETGECVNKSSCQVSSDCLPGYECKDGSCSAENSCEGDGDCTAGVCDEGACVNPESCTENSDCLEGTYCDTSAGSSSSADAGNAADAGSSDGSGKCVTDPCVNKTCKRGTCKRGTDRCVSEETCTEKTEILDCIAGEKCADGQCVGKDEFCNNLDCGDAGVCSFEEGGCVNSDDCSDDTECLDGYFCTEMSTCRPDRCERLGIDCGKNGVCQPLTGTCENANSCSSSDECKSNPQHLCVDGNCRLASTACGEGDGDGGCPGNQNCKYDSDNQSASCEEPATCATSLDCKGDRRCGGQTCLGPGMCRADEYEGNDSESDATIFGDVAKKGTLTASLCSGNDDFYEVDSEKIIDPTTRGTLVAEVNVPKRDRGLGKVKLELVDPDGNSVGTAGTGALGRDGKARVTTGIMVPDHGKYIVKVTPGSNMKPDGVRYHLSVDLLQQKAINACKNPDSISVNQRVSGTTKNTTSSSFGSSCTKPRNTSNEKIYSLTVDRPQELQFNLSPRLSTANLTMSLRKRCEQRGSEIACTDAGGDGDSEQMTKIVGPGTYYLVVQSPEGEDGGPFTLTINRIFTTCSSSGNYCDSTGKAHVCTVDGGRFRTVNCDNDCNPSTGQCVPPKGNKCGSAKTIDTMNAQTRTLALNQATDEYQVAPGGCLDSADTKTDGTDLSYKVKVPSRKSVRFEATFKNEVDGSLYLVEDCAKVDSTCKAGVKDSTSDDNREILKYSNMSMNNDETLFLIVDTDGGQEVTTAELKVKYRDVICSPGMLQCKSGGGTEKCNEYGVKYDTIRSVCGYSCVMGSGVCSAETCSTARNITTTVRQASGATTFSGSWDEFENTFEADDTCGGSGGSLGIDTVDTDGTDHVYQIDMKAGEGLKASLSGDGQFSLYLKSSGNCGSSGTSSSCLDSAEAEGSPVSVTYVASQQETIYLHADRESTSGGTFDLDVLLGMTQCMPGSYTPMCDGSGDLYQCNDAQLLESRNCASGCSSGQCDGETCSDAISVSKSGTPKTFKPYMGNYSDDYDVGPVGACGDLEASDDSPGPDLVLSVNASAGDVIDVTWQHDDATLYIVEDCSNLAGTCVDAQEYLSFSNNGNVTYTAANSQTYYVIVDVDESSATTISTSDLDVDVR